MTIIDNKLQVSKIRLTYILTFIAGSILVVYSMFSSDQAEGKLLGLILGLVLLLIFLYLLIIKPEYIYFSIDDNTKLIVRNYTAFPLFRKYKAYEIPLSVIFDYELKKVFFNKIISLRILIKKKDKVGKYPWLSFSAVPEKDLKKLISTMDKILPVKNRKKSIY